MLILKFWCYSLRWHYLDETVQRSAKRIVRGSAILWAALSKSYIPFSRSLYFASLSWQHKIMHWSSLMMSLQHSNLGTFTSDLSEDGIAFLLQAGKHPEADKRTQVGNGPRTLTTSPLCHYSSTGRLKNRQVKNEYKFKEGIILKFGNTVRRHQFVSW